MFTTMMYAGLILGGWAAANVIYNTYRPQIKGWIGETMVARALNLLVRQKKGHAINNVTVLKEDGSSSQIDNIFVNRSGIFVIETKNYSGMLVGRDNDRKWTQILGDKAYEAHNFAAQNAGHIKALQPILKKYPNLPVYSVLCFNDSLKTNLKLNDAIVTRYSTLGNAIKIRSKRNIISEVALTDIVNSLNKVKEKNKSVGKTQGSRVELQKEAYQSASKMHMSKAEYDQHLVNKYKKEAVSFDEYVTIKNKQSNLDNMVNDANARRQPNSHSNGRNVKHDYKVTR